jgi:hypothetical protein
VGQLHGKDRGLETAEAASFVLDQLSLNIKGASTVSNTPISAKLSFRLNETGTVAVGGIAKIEPVFAEMDFAVTNIDLRLVQPYVEEFAAMAITNGALTSAGKVRFQPKEPGVPQLTFEGGVRVADFATIDQVMLKEFVRWDDLTVSGIQAALEPNNFKVEEIRLVRPKASLAINTNRQSNLALILKKESKSESAETATTTTTAPSAPDPNATNSSAGQFPVQLGTLALDHASLGFTDESVHPHVAFDIEEITGTVKGLSTTTNLPAEVDLHGLVDPQSPFSITGRLNPSATSLFVDLIITNGNTQLTPFTGYMEKYGGYPLRKGKLSTTLNYHVEGSALQAENKIQVDQLTLGPHNDSPDATKAPVKLGIALLKDNDGRIDLDVPVSGRLDDPEFSLAPVVMKVVVNMIVKAAASPFKLLGALVGGGGDELSFVEFTPGTTNIIKGEQDKLNKLSAALVKRPALGLEIQGAVDPATDRAALARQKLRERLMAQQPQIPSAGGGAPSSDEPARFDSPEYYRSLRVAFVEQFGTNISEVILTNSARLTATNQVTSGSQPKPKRSILQRVTGIFGIGHSSGSKAERQLSKEDRRALGLASPDLMEDLLAEKIEVTDKEILQLSSDRARCVQDWMLQNGQIAADRLFIAEPRPVDATSSGERRVNLSLN